MATMTSILVNTAHSKARLIVYAINPHRISFSLLSLFFLSYILAQYIPFFF